MNVENLGFEGKSDHLTEYGEQSLVEVGQLVAHLHDQVVEVGEKQLAKIYLSAGTVILVRQEQRQRRLERF